MEKEKKVRCEGCGEEVIDIALQNIIVIKKGGVK